MSWLNRTPKGKNMETAKDKLSYVIGRQVGGDFKNQGMDLNFPLFLEGLESVYKGEEAKLSQEESLKVLQEFQKDLQEKRMEQEKALADANKAESDKFFAENKAAEGVITLDSGLQYKVIESGEGKTPSATDTVKTHYEGTLLNGDIFDSSYKRGEPISFPVNGVIQGWQEALQLMKEGDVWELSIPSELAYGPMGSPPVIGPHAALKFKIQLLEVNPAS